MFIGYVYVGIIEPAIIALMTGSVRVAVKVFLAYVNHVLVILVWVITLQ
jgi:hypothetical protein